MEKCVVQVYQSSLGSDNMRQWTFKNLFLPLRSILFNLPKRKFKWAFLIKCCTLSLRPSVRLSVCNFFLHLLLLSKSTGSNLTKPDSEHHITTDNTPRLSKNPKETIRGTEKILSDPEVFTEGTEETITNHAVTLNSKTNWSY